ncbi:hypothetical protein [Paracnuella aquatica]|uniref:hypothetical protein n=1 Tax=Paracnuella aquatica TaxID=2268757 RepID=UPI000DEFB16C|nr:hypothetical protein [Paracnuella aquatica]RPD44455.1 hypothetical protein DRJ53_17210 [Paracnuella aquatica]
MAYDIAVSGSDVYVVGHILSDAIIWKNGIVTKLNRNALPAKARGVALNGSDVYISGEDYNSSRVVYWKNGLTTALGSLVGKDPTRGNYIGVYGYDMAVTGNDVYVVGDTAQKAIYWKNGIGTMLSANNAYGTATAIVLSNKDVYISGVEDGNAVYWKNGVKTVLSTQNSGAYGIAVSGNDVYVAGNDSSDPVYWKNGVKTILPGGSPLGSAHANAIAIDGADVHVVGSTGVPVYWKNGILTVLPGANGASAASAIKIVRY